MAQRNTRRLKKHQMAQHRTWLLDSMVEIARLEGKLGLLTDEARAGFYGDKYLDPNQKLSKLLAAATTP